MSTAPKISFDLPEIFQWRNPIESGLACLTLNLIYLSCLLQGTGLIYLLTNYTFWFIVVAAIYLKVKALLGGSGSSAKSSSKDDDYVFVSQETCQRIVLFFHDAIVYLTQQIKTATHPEKIASLAKFLGGIYLLAIVGLVFSVQTLIWFALNGLFVYSFINYNEQAKKIVAPLIQTATGMVKHYAHLIYDKIPRYQAAK